MQVAESNPKYTTAREEAPAALPRYAAYRDSGVEWLGEIPEHWDVSSIRRNAVKITNGYVGPTRDILRQDGVKYLQSLHIKDHTIRFGHDYFVSKEWSELHKRSELQLGDVLIVQTGDIGQVACVPESFQGANCHALIVVSPNQRTIIGRYLSWTLFSSFGNALLKSVQTGALHPHLNSGQIKNLPIPLPPLPEQRAIANFLDEQTSHIDTLIQKKEHFIQLLEEKRSALISHAVTRGLSELDPTRDPGAWKVNFKDSGVEWLGEIPEHWEVKRLKFTARINPTKSECDLAPVTEVTFLPMEYVSETGVVDLSEERRLEEVYSGYTYFREDDVLLAKITPCFENGKAAIARGLKNQVGFGTTEFHVLRVSPNEPDFFYYLIFSYGFRQLGTSEMYGAGGQKRVPLEFLQNVRIPLPPLSEQRAIADFLDQQTQRIDTIIEKTKYSIELLKEKRSALISAAVTGQIKVPGVK